MAKRPSERQDRDAIRLRRDISKRKLLKLLELADDAEVLQLLWAVNILQSLEPDPARPYLQHPPEAVTHDLASPYAIRAWELETLATLLVTTRKSVGRHRLNARIWDNAGELVNALRSVEDAESGLRVDRDNIRQELSRIAQRQFPWQRSYFNPETLRRNLVVYGHGEARGHFNDKYGISIDEFVMTCTILYFEFLLHGWTEKFTYRQLSDNADVTYRVINLISAPLNDIGRLSTELFHQVSTAIGGALRIAYLPSRYRITPIISDPRRGLLAPLPELLIRRATSGLYYDFIGGPPGILKEAERRFEGYVAEMIPAYLPALRTTGEVEIGTKKKRFRTPDVLVLEGGIVRAVVECKATKNTFSAQFAHDLIEGGKRGIDQLCKGVVQLWRFFSAARRGLYLAHAVAPNAAAIVVTMDSWLAFSEYARSQIIADASAITDQHYPEILHEDRREVIFCPAEDLANVLAHTDVPGFFATLDAAVTANYFGWMLPEIMRDVGLAGDRKPFPFDPYEVLPWARDLPRR